MTLVSIVKAFTNAANDANCIIITIFHDSISKQNVALIVEIEKNRHVNYKNAQLKNHHLQTSKTFLMRMFVVFLDLTEPASRKANPACITAREGQIMLTLSK